MSWMIYGASGYTGRLLARLAKSEGETPILAGRHPQKILELARELDLPARIFPLTENGGASSELKDVKAVVNCAGPFEDTARPMLWACMRAGTHYLDITGEIDVFEAIFGMAQRLIDAGIAAIPGVGFDVVPTDCLAARLKERLPDANTLELAFDPGGGDISPGTTKTALRKLGTGRVRRNGKIVPVPPGHLQRLVPLRDPPSKPINAYAIPWGDVSTAYYTTGIPNITVYVALSERLARSMAFTRYVAWATRLPGVRRMLERAVEKRVKGPSADARARGEVLLWGRVEDPSGRSVELRMRTPDGYEFTIHSALAAVRRVVAGAVGPGPHTPAKAFGSGFAESLPGVRIFD